jgi:rare lipoprotein A
MGPHLRRRTSTISAVVLALSATVLLSACGVAPKRSGGFYQDDGPPDRVPADLASRPDARPRVEPFHPHANRPYRALGRNYVPMTTDAPLRQRGQASWYGRQFHGNRTSTGEIYDMFAMSAAHPTMPLPSYARVTHLRTGASVVVRVNDRGPFKDGRVIDLSYAAAVRLGIAGTGTGEVEVERLTHAQIRASGGAREEVVVAVPASPAPQAPAAAVVLPQQPGPWSVQLGAFENAGNAEALRERITVLLASPEADGLPAAVRQARVQADGRISRVLVGRLPDRAAAQQLSEELRRLLARDTTLYVRP